MSKNFEPWRPGDAYNNLNDFRPAFVDQYQYRLFVIIVFKSQRLSFNISEFGMKDTINGSTMICLENIGVKLIKGLN